MPDFFEILQLRFSALLPQAVAGLFVAIVFWVLARLLGGAVMRLQARVDDDHKELVDLLADVVGWGLFIIGIVAGLGTAGVDVTAMVAGLGLTGFALGFALKDALSNLISGVMILAYRPFTRGDRVQIGTHMGRVVEIDLRYTTLDAKGAKVMIPNAKAHCETIIVLKAQPSAPAETGETKAEK